MVGVLFEKRKARYRVVWVRYDGVSKKMLAAVQRMEADTCPWLEVLAEQSTAYSKAKGAPAG